MTSCSSTPDTPRPGDEPSPRRLALELTVAGIPVQLELTQKRDLLSDELQGRVRSDCYYGGEVRRLDGAVGSGPSWAALSTCDGLRGVVVLDGTSWSIEPDPSPDAVQLRPVVREPLEPVRSLLKRRELPQVPVSFKALSVPLRYVELALYTDTSFVAVNPATAPQRALDIANVADSLYRSGSVTPALAVTVKSYTPLSNPPPFTWTTLPGGETSSSSLLTAFQGWLQATPAAPRGDTQFLLTALNFDGSTIGLAGLGTMCSTSAAGITQNTFNSAAFHGLTLAHELGHNLGMRHDGDGNACNLSAFVMSASSCSNCGSQPTSFSSCSQSNYSSFLASGDARCLENLPGTFVQPRCGDGVVQAPERCDCGDADCSVIDPCCDGATCQLKAGAECATLDGCCDACKVATTQRACLSPAGQCDLGSVCNTVSPYCPPRLNKPAGTACNDGQSSDGGQCYSGACVSHLAQCVSMGSKFPVTGLTTCTNQAAFNSGNFCNTLYCGTNNNPSQCTGFGPPSVLMQDGVSCEAGKQCVNKSCVPSASIDPVLTLSFVTGAWSACTQECGGTQSRAVVCTDQFGRPVPDGGCAGPKPPSSQSCGPACPDYQWVVGAFEVCSASCGDGTQTRAVTCVDQTTMSAVADLNCSVPKPVTSQACTGTSCGSGGEGGSAGDGSAAGGAAGGDGPTPGGSGAGGSAAGDGATMGGSGAGGSAAGGSGAGGVAAGDGAAGETGGIPRGGSVSEAGAASADRTEGGCGCSVPGRSPSSWGWGLGLLALIGSRRRALRLVS